MILKSKFFLLMVILLLQISCNKEKNKKYFDSGFTLTEDTIAVNVRGKLTYALKFEGKYFVLFEETFLKYGSNAKRWLYVFNNGKLEKKVNCPRETFTSYIDFYQKNDSIIIKTYSDKQGFYYDNKKNIWEKINNTDDLIFEDEKFYVYSLDFGEWVGKTWFKDKKTNRQYLIEVATPLVNKINNTYYLTTSQATIEIKDPLDLIKCKNEYLYENIEENNKHYIPFSTSKGYTYLHINKDQNLFKNVNSYNVSAFVHNNELLNIQEDNFIAYISKIQNGKIEKIEKLKENIDFFNYYASYRCKNINGTNELLKFETTKTKMFGLMDIEGNDITITYFKNSGILQPKALGKIKADKILIERLHEIKLGFEKLSVDQIEANEAKRKSFEVSPLHLISVSDKMNPNKYKIDINKSYYTVEDSLISNDIMYYISSDSGFVRAITINWEETDNENPYDFSDKLQIPTKKAFSNKVEKVSAILINEFGKPDSIKKHLDGSIEKLIWKNNSNLVLEFDTSINKNSTYNYMNISVFSKKIEYKNIK